MSRLALLVVSLSASQHYGEEPPTDTTGHRPYLPHSLVMPPCRCNVRTDDLRIARAGWICGHAL